MNTIHLVGRLANDPTFTPASSDAKSRSWVVVAVNRPTASDDADFIPVTCFGRTAEVVGQWGEKGRQVVVEGHLRSNAWNDDAGNPRRSLDVIARRFQFLGPRPVTADNGEDDSTGGDS